MFSAFIAWAMTLFVFLRPDVPVVDINEGAWLSYRLPTSVKPEHYDIQLFPDMYSKKSATFEGEETITVQVINSTRYILLHISGINITSTSLRNRATNTAINVESTFKNLTTQLWVIECNEILPRDSILDIYLSFVGRLDHRRNGLFKSSFKVPSDNRTRYMVSSQFEPIAARKAFPCFDEPSFKAFYTMRLVHKRSHRALFNSMETSVTNMTLRHRDGDDLVVTQFEKTEYPMSTYIVAMAVVESYDYVTKNTTDGRLMRYFGRQDRISEIKYASDIGWRSREYFDNLFEFKSPLKKVDMLGIESGGAMENWGLIIYGNNGFLRKADNSDLENYSICRVIAHELAHTWFGNIVTMKWWDELWLNEAFATYFEAVGMSVVCPEWNAVLFANLEDRKDVMLIDTYIRTSLPINPKNWEQQEPGELFGMFNMFTYMKGASLLHWLNTVLGRERFITGLRKYLKANKYSTGTPQSLFSHWDETGKYSSAEIMNGWLYQSGYPIVSVGLSANNRSLIISQKCVFIPPNATAASTAPYNSTWWIEVKILSNESRTSIRPILRQSEKQKTISSAGLFDANRENSWILLNSDSFGYYRSHYDPVLFKRLVDAISNNPESFDELQRAVFIHDTFELTKLGFYNFSQAFAATRYLHKEKGFSPWYYISSNITLTGRLMVSSKYDLYMRNKTSGLFHYWNATSLNKYPKNLQRESFFGLACQYENPDGSGPCLKTAQTLFQNWLVTKVIPLPKEVHKYVYFYGLQQNNTELNWQALYDELKNPNATDATTKHVLFGLGAAPERLGNLFSKILKQDNGKWHRSWTIISIVELLTSTEAATRALWNWTRERCENSTFTDAVAIGNDTDFCDTFLPLATPILTKYFHKLKDYHAIVKVLLSIQDEDNNEDIAKMKERIFAQFLVNFRWMSTAGREIKAFLNNHFDN